MLFSSSKGTSFAPFLHLAPFLTKFLSGILLSNRRGKGERNGKSFLSCTLFPLQKHRRFSLLLINNNNDHSK